MTSQILRVLCLLFLCGLSATANAHIVRYDFSGTVGSAFKTNPTSASQDVFGAITSPGDPFTGFFEVDLGAPQSVVFSGIESGEAVGYDMNPSLRMQILLNGVTFENDGTFLVGVINDFSDDSLFPPFDGLSILDGRDPNDTGEDFVGVTFLAGGVPQSGVFGFNFADSTANAFSSTSLPSNLNLSDFDLSTGNGFISGLDGNMDQIGLDFIIDTVSVTAVPEPGSFCFIAAAALGVLRRRRRA